MKNVESRIKNITDSLRSADINLKKAHSLLEALRKDLTSSFDDVPGTLGVFDGTHMVTPEGERFEVNPNYAAKSLLMSGDNLKMIEKEDGKLLFKQVSKADRVRVEGVLNKKEGKWYALTDSGSYRILDVAVEFRGGEVKDAVTVLVPKDNLKAEYAALEKMAKEDVKVEEKEEEPKEEEKPKVEKKAKPKKAAEKEKKPVKKATKKAVPKKAATKRKPVRKRKPRVEKKAPTADPASLLGDDDLR